MIVFHHPRHRRHDPREDHVFAGQSLPPAEVAHRADRILSGLTGVDLATPELIDADLLAAVHDPDYLEFLETAHSRWREATQAPASGEAVPYIRPIPGTPWSEPGHVLAQLGRYSSDVDPILEGTWEGALASASCAVAAADTVTAGRGPAYALCRPPGHHAGPASFGGYCYLNNAAMAVSRLTADGGRAAVIDLDTHHGNGTQTIFWDRPDVMTVSLHGDPVEHYPFFLGHVHETGGPGAPGANRNFPLATGTTWDGYRLALEEALATIRSFRADALVVALGVDTHADHGVMALAGDDYRRLGATIGSLGLPTVVVQEGGYAPGSLEEAVPAFLEALADTWEGGT
jgi:acetoin utilization deacetylase AcuC-like enzyme